MSLDRDAGARDGYKGGSTKSWVPRSAPETPVPGEGELASYQLGEKLDAAGEVYEAYHPRFPERFVLKLFPAAAAEGPEAVKAFAREAGRISILRHPHIVQVLDSGVLVDRTPFLAMERLPGQTLERRLESGPLPLPQLMPVLRGIVSALSAAHAAGICHREIRPDNVFLAAHADGGAGLAKVLDFGVSQLTWAERASSQGVGAVAARYLAPEQVVGGLTAVDPRTDQFAVAALTYRMLTGADAFPATINVNTLDRWVDNTPRPAIPSVRGVSAVDAVLYKALGKHPDDRYPSVAAFFRAFEEAIANSEPTETPSRFRRVFFRAAPRATERGVTERGLPAPNNSAPAQFTPSTPSASSVLRPSALDVLGGKPSRQSKATRRRSAQATSGSDEVTKVQPLVTTGELTERVPGASLTQQFFRRGDELERTRWKSAIPGRDTLAPRPVEFTSFNRVPRHRKPLLVLVMIALVVGGVFAVRRLGAPSPRDLWGASRLGRSVHMFRAGLPWRGPAPSAAVSGVEGNSSPAGDIILSEPMSATAALGGPAPVEPTGLGEVPANNPAPAVLGSAAAVEGVPVAGLPPSAGATESVALVPPPTTAALGDVEPPRRTAQGATPEVPVVSTPPAGNAASPAKRRAKPRARRPIDQEVAAEPAVRVGDVESPAAAPLPVLPPGPAAGEGETAPPAFSN